jgi:hypothetical protein
MEKRVEDHSTKLLSTSICTDPPPLDTVARTIHKKTPDCDQLRPFFSWISPDIIKKTFQHATQYARLPTGTTFRRAFKAPNPALNVTPCILMSLLLMMDPQLPIFLLELTMRSQISIVSKLINIFEHP